MRSSFWASVWPASTNDDSDGVDGTGETDDTGGSTAFRSVACICRNIERNRETKTRAAPATPPQDMGC